MVPYPELIAEVTRCVEPDHDLVLTRPGDARSVDEPPDIGA